LEARKAGMTVLARLIQQPAQSALADVAQGVEFA
jgi:hypothetical protein